MQKNVTTQSLCQLLLSNTGYYVGFGHRKNHKQSLAQKNSNVIPLPLSLSLLAWLFLGINCGESGSKPVDQVKTEASTFTNEVVGTVTSTVSNIAFPVITATQELTTAAVSTVSAVTTPVLTATQDVTNATVSKISAVAAPVISPVTSAAQNLTSSASAGLSTLTTPVAAVTQKVATAASTTIATVTSPVTTVTQELTNAAASTVSAIASPVATATQEVTNAANSTVSAIASPVATATQEVTNAATKTVATATQEVTNAAAKTVATVTNSTAPRTYTVGGTISGLNGSGLVLQNNAQDNLTISSGAEKFTFLKGLSSGESYTVSILSQASGSLCTLSNGSGKVASSNITNVALTCIPQYTIGGTISGLGAGSVILQNNDEDTLTVRAKATNFTFGTALSPEDTYGVKVLSQPSGFLCSVAGGTGTIASANVNTISITCSALGAMSMSPSSGWPGTVVTFTGFDFSTASSVTVGGAAGVIVTKSSSKLVAVVGTGLSSGLAATIKLADGSSYTSATNFTVNATGLPSSSQGQTKITGAFQEAGPVAISADGNTAALGYIDQNSPVGRIYILTRSGNSWSQQANFIGAGKGYLGAQGKSLRLSADGNTCVFASPEWAWSFTRSGTTWTQEYQFTSGYYTATYVGDASVNFAQGFDLALDGNTAVFGAPAYKQNAGVVQIWTRSGTKWSKTQTLDSPVAGSGFGSSLALSGNGTTLAVGSSNVGVSIYTLVNGKWTAQGSRLLGSGGATNQGGFAFDGMALSFDGNTLAFTAETGTYTGGFFIFARSGSTWGQQAGPIRGTPRPKQSGQYHLSLSADGNSLALGGEGEGTGGSMYLFSRSGSTWTQSGSNYTGGSANNFGYHLVLAPDGQTLLISDKASFYTYTP